MVLFLEEPWAVPFADAGEGQVRAMAEAFSDYRSGEGRYLEPGDDPSVREVAGGRGRGP